MKMDDYINKLNTDRVYPLHMPGHKRNREFSDQFAYNPYMIDITEIDGYDNLHNPEGMIAELEERISGICGAYRSFVLVNGSTSGILAAISSVTNYGDKILIARNSHKSAYNALCIRGLDADYLYPEQITELDINGIVSVGSVDEALKANEIQKKTQAENRSYKAVYITSPTYEGVVSDIKRIAARVHEAGIPLIVDEAHGAHFGMSEHFPESAVRLGADIVIQSTHKTLPGMTQTAVLHVSEDAIGRIDIDKLQYYLRVYQTSSPSYVLMSSVDNCYRYINEHTNIWDVYYKRLCSFYERCKEFKDICIYSHNSCNEVDKKKIFDFDCGKLVIYSRNRLLTGRQIYDLLRAKGLQLEMSLGRYCLAMTSCMDTDEGFNRLYQALYEIDINNRDRMRTSIERVNLVNTIGQRKCVARYTIAQAFEAGKELARLAYEDANNAKDEAGRELIAADYAYVYPPGIPLVVPGEVITKEIIMDIENLIANGYEVHGIIEREDKLFFNLMI